MYIIDFHTHTFPDNIAPIAIQSLEKSSNDKAFLNGTTTDIKRSMKKAGIKQSVLLPIAVKPQNTATINKVAIENNKDNSFISFGSVHPHNENYKEELITLKKAGIKGIKLHPDFQGVFIDDPKMVEVMQFASELNFIITLHSGFDVSFPDLQRCTPKRLAKVIDDIKGARIICAHSGGYRYLDEFKQYLLGRPEIYIDTSYSIDKMDNEELTKIYTQMDSSHILFGTDSPWRVVKRFTELNISDDLKQKVLYENGQALLK